MCRERVVVTMGDVTPGHHPQEIGKPSTTRARHALLMAPAVLLLIAWCGWVSGLHRSTAAAEITWLVSLSFVVTVDLLLWRGRTRQRPGLRLEPAGQVWPRPDHRPHAGLLGVTPWLALSLVVLLWEVLGIDTGTHEPHLTISALTQAFRPLNAAMLLIWIAVGVGYGAARARAPVVFKMPSASGPDSRGMGSVVAVGLMSRPGATAVLTTPALLLPANRGVGVAFWVAVVLAAVVIEFVARHSKGRLADAEEFVRYITGPPVANIVLVVAWVYAGFHLFAR